MDISGIFRFNFIMRAGGILGVGLLTACAPATTPSGINDPWGASNRAAHEFNKKLDTNFLRPLTARKSSRSGPSPVSTGIKNFAGNLSTPGMVVNNLLQADAEGAIANTVRFALNSTIGVVGIFDVATVIGVPEHDTDFGETLYVWGAEEGNYMELPLLGPSTERDTIGRVVDLFTNPLSYVLPSPEKYAGTAAKVAGRIGDRGRYAQTIDSVLYDSADSYAQGRVTYLQNRRYELSGDAGFADPYDDPYGDTGDPYDDPYLQ